MEGVGQEMKCVLAGSRDNSEDGVEVSPKKCRKQDSKWAAFVCASATFCQTAVIGLILCYGVLFPSISETLGSNRALTAGVHSLRSAFLFCTGPVSGALCTRFNCRKVNSVGIILISLGYLLSSFATGIETLYFTIGMLVGIGSSMTHISNLSAVTMYFNKYQNLAMGFALSGNTMGLFILAPVTRELLKAFRLFNTLRVFAAICLLPLCFTFLAYDPHVESPQCKPQALDEGAPRRKFQLKKLIKFRTLKNRQFIFIIIAMAFHYFAIATPPVHLARHCLDIGISEDLSAQAYTVYAAVGVIGRILFGRLGDWKRINNRHIIQLCMVMAGVTNCLMPRIKTFPVIIAYVISIGIFTGAVVSLIPGLIARAVGKREYAQAQGLFMFFMCPFVAAGSALSGMIADKTGGYSAAFYMIGSSQLLCALLSLLFMYFGSEDSDSKNDDSDEPTTEESEACVLQQRITVL